MTAWIVYDKTTLDGIRYRTGGAFEPVFNRRTEAVLEVPEPATAYKIVEVEDVITFELQSDINPQKRSINHERASQLVSDVLIEFEAGDPTELAKLLTRLVLLSNVKE